MPLQTVKRITEELSLLLVLPSIILGFPVLAFHGASRLRVLPRRVKSRHVNALYIYIFIFIYILRSPYVGWLDFIHDSLLKRLHDMYWVVLVFINSLRAGHPCILSKSLVPGESFLVLVHAEVGRKKRPSNRRLATFATVVLPTALMPVAVAHLISQVRSWAEIQSPILMGKSKHNTL